MSSNSSVARESSPDARDVPGRLREALVDEPQLVPRGTWLELGLGLGSGLGLGIGSGSGSGLGLGSGSGSGMGLGSGLGSGLGLWPLSTMSLRMASKQVSWSLVGSN